MPRLPILWAVATLSSCIRVRNNMVDAENASTLLLRTHVCNWTTLAIKFQFYNVLCDCGLCGFFLLWPLNDFSI